MESENKLAIVISQNCFLYEKPGDSDGSNRSEITDEIFSGWAVRILEEGGQGSPDVWVRVTTHYGYEGYVLLSQLERIPKEELVRRQDPASFRLVCQAAADVLPGPEVETGLSETLLRDSIVELIHDSGHDSGHDCRQKPGEDVPVSAGDTWEEDSAPGRSEPYSAENASAAAAAGQGFTLVRTAAGTRGYIHSVFLSERRDDDRYLLEDFAAREDASLPSERPDGQQEASLPKAGCCGEEGFFNRRAAEVTASRPEAQLRQILTETARSYLGTQYRWAGKSAMGIDCSGLTFMCYRQIGVLVYRDARIRADYPVREIGREQLRPGDLIFFEGHVAMYLGGDEFIHATAWPSTPCVTINSLNPESPLYRADLPGRLLWYGSIFRGERVTKTQEDEDRILAARQRAVRAGEEECLLSIRGRLEQLPGKVSFYYRNLKTGISFGMNQDHPHQAASIIKLYLMAAMFDGFERGLFRPDFRIPVPLESKAPSCGVLTYLSDTGAMSLRDLIELMIIVSDNTATNLLWDFYESRCGAGSLKRFVGNLPWLKATQMNRKMFDSVKAEQGIKNYTSAADAGHFLEAVRSGRLISKTASAAMLRILKDQRLNGKIPARLHVLASPPSIAHKTGEDGGITHDAAIVEGRRPMILCFMGSDTDVPALERLMGDAALELYRLGE